MDDFNLDILYEGFLETLENDFGIDIKNKDIEWTGFVSQGDGLCFDFNISGKDTIKLLKHFEVDRNLINAINKDKIDISIGTYKNSFATHYCHSNTREIDIEVDYSLDLKKTSPKLYQLLESDIFEKLKIDIKSWYIDICDKLYDDLYEMHKESNELDNEEMDFDDR